MNWLLWLYTPIAGGINLHALGALVISRGSKPAPALRRLARRSKWLALGLIVFSVALTVLAVRQAASAAPAPRSTSAPLPVERAKSAPRPDHGAAAEQRSLGQIQALLKTDPTAARAALERHKKVFVFPFEHYPEERASIQERVMMKLAAQRQVHPGAGPP